MDEIEIQSITSESLNRMGFGFRIKGVAPPFAQVVPSEGKRRGKPPLPPDQLRVSQLRILGALSEVESDSVVTAISFEQIMKKTKLGDQTVLQALGPKKEESLEAHDKRFGFRCLLSRGLVVSTNLDGQHRYYLTNLGQRKADDLEDDIIKANNTSIRVGRGLKAENSKKEPKPKRQPKRVKKDVESVSELPQPE